MVDIYNDEVEHCNDCGIELPEYYQQYYDLRVILCKDCWKERKLNE